MKSRDYRILASVLAALVMVLGAVRWATAQQGSAAVHGSGTPNSIPVWTDSGTIGDSSITRSGNGDQTINGSLGVTGSLGLLNTAGPSTRVISFGGVPAVHTFSGIGKPNPPTNMFVGQNAGNFTMSGINNSATGAGSLFSNADGTDNAAMGTHSLFVNTSGNNKTAIGVIALQVNTVAAATPLSVLKPSTGSPAETKTSPTPLARLF
jgi:hypothetical protein